MVIESFLKERCPVCFQPDNCGDCNHEELSDSDYQSLRVDKVVAVVYRNNEIYDVTFNWESAQSYAANGDKVVAIWGDGHLTKEECQKMYDYEKECYEDCFGVE